MTPDQYRVAHGLPASAALVADATRARLAAGVLSRTAAGALDPLAAYRNREHLAAASAAGREAVAASHHNQIANTHRAPARAAGIAAMAAHRARRMDQVARDAGYRDMDHAIMATFDHSLAEAGRLIGISPQTIRRRRADLLLRSAPAY